MVDVLGAIEQIPANDHVDDEGDPQLFAQADPGAVVFDLFDDVQQVGVVESRVFVHAERRRGAGAIGRGRRWPGRGERFGKRLFDAEAEWTDRAGRRFGFPFGLRLVGRCVS